MGEDIEEPKIVKKFLKSLPRKKYIHIVAALEQVLNLKNTTFEDIVGRIKTYEDRVCDDDDDAQEDQGKLMYANMDSQYDGGRGRGRGRSRGKGRGRSGYQQRDKSKVICYRCDKIGHYASDCPDRLLKLIKESQENGNEDDDEIGSLMVHEVVYLNERNVDPKVYEASSDKIWYLDNGASNHMTGVREWFCKLDEEITEKVRFGDDSCIDIKGKGSIIFVSKIGEKKILANVYYIPDLKSNIVSLGQATEAGCAVVMKDDYLTLHDREGILLIRAKRSKNRLYKVILEVGVSVIKCLRAVITNERCEWHARLGHISYETIKAMVKNELVIGMTRAPTGKETCESCLLGKQTRQTFPQATSYRALSILELIHGDLCGPISPSTAARRRYMFVLIDDCSRYMWSLLLREKSEAFEKFKGFKALVEQETGAKIKTLRTYRGGEFMSQEFQDFCEKEGINRHLTAPYTPQQNGVVERRNRTLLEMTKSIMKHMNVPNYLWGEAVRHSTYLINRVGTKTLKNQTPYEALKNKKPNVDHLRVFGCVSFAKVEAQHLKKLDDRSKMLVYLGTEPDSKAYRLLDPTTRRITVSRDVVFDESRSWSWNKTDGETHNEPGSFTVQLREIGNDEDREDETGQNGDDADDGNSASHEDEEDTSNENLQQEETLPTPAAPVLRKSGRQTTIPSYLDDYVLLADEEGERLLMVVNDEPWDFKEANESREWRDACKDEITSIEKNKTWSLVDLPAGVKPIGLKWDFKLKHNSDGTINKYKARLVAKGYVQRHGIDFDEVFALVARIETIRVLIALAASNTWEVHHLDVKTAFLHGDLKEDVFVSQPEGFITKGSEEKVYKLHKALYGLRQAPRAWNIKLNKILRDLGFEKCSKEPSIYWKEEGENLLVVAVYVDDLLVTDSSVESIINFKLGMSKMFEMSDLGRLTYYLGIEVTVKEDGVVLKQERYAKKILEETGMSKCNPDRKPMIAGLELSKALDEKSIDRQQYRRSIGCLRYLPHTRPDLSYSVGILSRYMQGPRESHGAALKRVLRYLQGTPSLGLYFKHGGQPGLVGYSDSSHNVDADHGKSTGGHVFYLNECLITWCSQKQQVVSLSSCEAEFMAATEAAKQAIWLQDLFAEVTGTECEKVVIQVDNKSAIALTKNPVFHGRSKHIHRRYHFIRECVENGLVEVEHVPGVEQKADILTKALGRVKFIEMRELIGVQEEVKENFKLKEAIVG